MKKFIGDMVVKGTKKYIIGFEFIEINEAVRGRIIHMLFSVMRGKRKVL